MANLLRFSHNHVSLDCNEYSPYADANLPRHEWRVPKITAAIRDAHCERYFRGEFILILTFLFLAIDLNSQYHFRVVALCNVNGLVI